VQAPTYPTANVLVSSADWMVAVVTGSAASALGVLSIASLGYLMLSGRLPLRRGALAVLGCFILFGAPTLARGLVNAQARPSAPLKTASSMHPLRLNTPIPPDTGHDPYAGAAVRR
jgi:type IV secretory pathway VirB2 component (pilin)